MTPGWRISPRVASGSRETREPPGHPPTSISSRLPQTYFPATPAGPLPRPPGSMLTNTQQPMKVYTLRRTSSGTTRTPGYVEEMGGHVLASQGLTKHGPQEKGTTL